MTKLNTGLAFRVYCSFHTIYCRHKCYKYCRGRKCCKASNIPTTDLLSDQYTDILNQDVKMNVFYSNGTLTANEAWMVTRQLGYINNFVLEGGLNYWFEAILNPQKPSSTSADEEFAKYDFRKSAGLALGGGGTSVQTTQIQSATSAKPAVSAVGKKKKVAGGC